MTLTTRLMVLMWMVGCTEPAATITVNAPDYAARLELNIITGECPTLTELEAGVSGCGPGVLHRQSIMENGAFRAPPPIEGPHAVVIIASGGGAVGYACASLREPSDVLFDEDVFTPGTCGARPVRSDGTCGEVPCGVLDGGVSDAGAPDGGPSVVLSEEDSDGDGLSNCIECCDSQPAACECNVEIEVGLCLDSDNDGDPDYLDADSDDDGYEDSTECFSYGDGRYLCDHGENRQQDQRIVNRRDDYDADGITNNVECPSQEVPNRECVDTDGDGYPDFRDLDSDGDGETDRDECPAGSSGVERPCRDDNGDGIPDFLQSMLPPGECGCEGESYACAIDGDGRCIQREIEVLPTLMLSWINQEGMALGVAQSAVDVLIDLTFLDIPSEAWRCRTPPCAMQNTVAVAEISEGGEVVAYLVDLFEEDARVFVGELEGLRPGRFVYLPDGQIAATIP